MARILIVYYSAYGHIEKMAEAVAEGTRVVAGTKSRSSMFPGWYWRQLARNPA